MSVFDHNPIEDREEVFQKIQKLGRYKRPMESISPRHLKIKFPKAAEGMYDKFTEQIQKVDVGELKI